MLTKLPSGASSTGRSAFSKITMLGKSSLHRLGPCLPSRTRHSHQRSVQLTLGVPFSGVQELRAATIEELTDSHTPETPCTPPPARRLASRSPSVLPRRCARPCSP